MAELTLEEKRKVRKPMLWIAMASMAMAFAGLTSGYVVSRKALLQENMWMQFNLPAEFTYSTIVIVLSSITLFIAGRLLKKDDIPNTTRMIWATFVLGGIFFYLQIKGYQSLMDVGLYFTGGDSGPSSSWVYAISGVHLLHLVAGLIALAVTGNKASRGGYSPSNKLGFELTTQFWHFLDILWVYLFLFLVFIR
jgi:cytochrome c oxidase subunit 3